MGIDGAGTRPPSRSRSGRGVSRGSREHSGIDFNAGFTALSRRECEVLSLIALGMTDRQIAEELVVSRVTISTHVAHILDKLGVPNRTAAVAVASGAVRYAGSAD